MGIESSAHTHTHTRNVTKIKRWILLWLRGFVTVQHYLLICSGASFFSSCLYHQHDPSTTMSKLNKCEKAKSDCIYCLMCVRVCLIFFYRCSRSTIISIRSCTCSNLMACLFYCYVCSVYLSGIGSAMIARHMEERIRARDRNCVAHWIHRALHTQIVYTLNHSRVKSFSSHINHPHITSHALFFFCYCNRQRQFPLLPLSHFHSHLAFPFSLHRSEHVWHIPNLYGRHIKFYSHLHMHK